MEWLSENWVFLLIVVGMVVMHLFGHGGHGRREDEDQNARKGRGEQAPRGGHQH